MKTNHPSLRILGVIAFASVAAACGNAGLLSQLTGSGASGNSSGNAAEQAAENMLNHVCGDCPAPEGGATELFAHITPESSQFDPSAPLELALVIGDPAGVVDSTGAWRVSKTFVFHDVDLAAALPDSAWKISTDGTEARVVLDSDGPLPAGSYLAKGSITDGEHTADASEVYVVPSGDGDGDHGTPTPEPTSTGDHHEPTPTPTATGDGDHTPTPTPTGDGNGDGGATPTPTPN